MARSFTIRPLTVQQVLGLAVCNSFFGYCDAELWALGVGPVGLDVAVNNDYEKHRAGIRRPGHLRVFHEVTIWNWLFSSRPRPPARIVHQHGLMDLERDLSVPRIWGIWREYGYSSFHRESVVKGRSPYPVACSARNPSRNERPPDCCACPLDCRPCLLGCMARTWTLRPPPLPASQQPAHHASRR